MKEVSFITLILTNISVQNVIADDFDAGEVVAHSSPEIVRTVTTNSETNFQRKITVSQTQL